MLNLRTIFDKNRIPWIDRGANTSAGNVSIPCPFCGNDPSYHLSVSEEGQGYYCWRNPRHAGNKLFFLFKALHIPTDGIDFKELDVPSEDLVAREQPAKDYSMWSFFAKAESTLFVLEYLKSRGFSMPAAVIKQFDLRVDLVVGGKWSQRLLIPLTKGWTGRAMLPSMQPRYLSNTDESGYFVYGKPNHKSLLIFEGPLDAMRAASMSKQFDVAATTGKRMSPTFLFFLRERDYKTIHIIPDNDVPPHEYYFFLRYLSSFCTHSEVKLLTVPQHVKDLCDLSEEETLQWINSLGDPSLSHGLVHGLFGRVGTAPETAGG